VRGLVTFVLVPLGIYAGLCLLLFLTQRSQIYFPVPESRAAGARAEWLAVPGARVKVWVVERPGEAAILYFGGNAEDVAYGVLPLSRAFPRHSLYLVNYRGYGGSGGSPSERALVGDAVALYDRLHPRHAEISVVGRSLGGAVALELAAGREVERLVLVTPFDSLVNVARFHVRWAPVGLLLRDRYESARRAPDVDAETLVVIAGDDEIIPRARSEALVAALPPARTRVIVIDGARHNDLDASPRYLAELQRFLGT
jgi:uncharacterized protein